MHGIIPPGRWGSVFYWILWDIQFSPSFGALSRMGDLKFFTLMEGQRTNFVEICFLILSKLNFFQSNIMASTIC